MNVLPWTPAWVASTVMLTSLVFGTPVHAGERTTLRADLQAVERLAELDNDKALARMPALREAANADAPVAVQREVLMLHRRLLLDAGRRMEAFAVNDTLRALGQGSGDRVALLEAQLADVERMLDDRQVKLAQGLLENVKAGARTVSDPRLQFRLEMAQARMSVSRYDHEGGMAHYMRALELADKQGEASGLARLAAATGLSRVLALAMNPDKALALLDRVQADTAGGHPTQLALLYVARAHVLATVGRADDAAAAYEQALAISRRHKIVKLEALVLGGMADLDLSLERYPEAEQAARQAFALAQASGDVFAQRVARANIGFALGGQGHLAEALPYIDGVTREFEEAGSTLEASMMLEEKGTMLERLHLYKDALAAVRAQYESRMKHFQAENARTEAALHNRFESERKQREIEVLQRSNQLKDEQLSNRALRTLAATLASAVLLVIAGAAWLMARRARMANRALREANTRLEYHAAHDPLTGLFNRRTFVERMQARTRALMDGRSERASNSCFVILDVDHFKRINDHHGHAAGDAVLVEVARRLQAVVRAGDIVMRWGGEEFLVYAPDATIDQAAVVVGRLLEAIGATPVVLPDITVAVTVSAGFVALPFAGLSEFQCGWERVIKLADAALYVAKRDGRNRAWGLVDMPPDAGCDALDRLAAIESDPADAMQRGLVLTYAVAGPRQEPARHAAAEESSWLAQRDIAVPAG